MKATRDQIIAAHPVDAYLAAAGREIVTKGGYTKCLCPFHQDKHPSLRIDTDKGLWFCDPCGIGGTVIDLEMRLNNVSVKQAMRSLAEKANLLGPDDAKPHKVATYKYTDPMGRPAFAVDRVEEGQEKKFTQYHYGPDGKPVFKMDGVERFPYKLTEWSGLDEINLVEGEKCVHAMNHIGFPATTNAGGSNGWIDGLSVYFKNKHVNIWPDNDPSGGKWLEAVTHSLSGKVASFRVMRAPAPYNDVADLVNAKGDEYATSTINEIMGNTGRISRGVTLPLLSSQECYERYMERAKTITTMGIDLGVWIPDLRKETRVLLPGDLVTFVADTGVGKTTLMVDLAYTLKVPTVVFQLELMPEDMCERFIARDLMLKTLMVEAKAISGTSMNVSGWNHVHVVDMSSVTMDNISDIVQKAELKMGVAPRLVIVDYIGLVSRDKDKSKTEALADIAEGMKVLAKQTKTTVIMTAQVARDKKRDRIGLHDAKDSSSIETSSQLVMAIERPEFGRVRITGLKQTKKASGWEVMGIFDGDHQRILPIPDPLDAPVTPSGAWHGSKD